MKKKKMMISMTTMKVMINMEDEGKLGRLSRNRCPEVDVAFCVPISITSHYCIFGIASHG